MLLLSPFHQAHKKHQQKQQRPNLSTPAKNRLLFCADTSTTADTLPFPSPQQPPPSSASSASVASADVSSSKATSWNNQATLVATTAALNEFLLVIMMTMVSTTQDDYNNNNNTVLSSKYTLTFTTTAITDYFVLSSSSLSWYKRNIPDDKRLRKKLNISTKATTENENITDTGSQKQRQHQRQEYRPRIVGHRGSLYQELENTRESFMACTGICQAVELDVFRLPKDGTLVVFHGSGTDENPGLLDEYCTNANTLLLNDNNDEKDDGRQQRLVPRSILDLTYEQTQQLKFNINNPELAAPTDRILTGKIPTLEQVLMDMKSTGLEVKIELKGKETARPVVELVDRLQMVDQVSFASFNHDEIITVRQMRPQTTTTVNERTSYVYRTGALYNDHVPEDFIQHCQAIGASEIHLKYDTCTKERIQAIHAAGMSSMCWMRGPVGMLEDIVEKYWDIGNEDETCYEVLVDTGVQQLCVNKPHVLLNYLNAREELLKQQQQQSSQINGKRKPRKGE